MNIFYDILCAVYKVCLTDGVFAGQCTPADGTQGNCPDNQICYTDGVCDNSCSPVGGMQGNCPQGQLCYIDGKCNNGNAYFVISIRIWI